MHHPLDSLLVRRSSFQQLTPWPALDSEQTGEKFLLEFELVPEITNLKKVHYDKLVVVVAAAAVVAVAVAAAVAVDIGEFDLDAHDSFHSENYRVHSYSPFPNATDETNDNLLHHSPFHLLKQDLEIFLDESERGHEEKNRGELAEDDVERECWRKPSLWPGFDRTKNRKDGEMSDLEEQNSRGTVV